MTDDHPLSPMMTAFTHTKLSQVPAVVGKSTAEVKKLKRGKLRFSDCL